MMGLGLKPHVEESQIVGLPLQLAPPCPPPARIKGWPPLPRELGQKDPALEKIRNRSDRASRPKVVVNFSTKMVGLDVLPIANSLTQKSTLPKIAAGLYAGLVDLGVPGQAKIPRTRQDRAKYVWKGPAVLTVVRTAPTKRPGGCSEALRDISEKLKTSQPPTTLPLPQRTPKTAPPTLHFISSFYTVRTGPRTFSRAGAAVPGWRHPENR